MSLHPILPLTALALTLGTSALPACGDSIHDCSQTRTCSGGDVTGGGGDGDGDTSSGSAV